MENTGLTPESITLDFYNSTATRFGVTWQSEEAGTPVLEYTDPSDVNFLHAKRIPGEVSDNPTVEGMKVNRVLLGGLAPGERYLYRVGDATGVFSGSAELHIPENDPDKLTFLVFSDTQDAEETLGSLWQLAWRDGLERYRDTSLFVHAGDIVQCGDDRTYWKEMMRHNEAFVRSYPMIGASGNHDYWYCRHAFVSHYTIDYPPQDTTHGIFYSVDVGPVHFTVISSGDSMRTENDGLTNEQLVWLENDLRTTDKPWKIAVTHNPLYSPGKYGWPICGVSTAMRGQLDGMLARLGVDLVICGHDHALGKSYPILESGEPQADYKYTVEDIDGISGKIALDVAGPIHFEPGCAGTQPRQVADGEGELPPEYARFFEVAEDTPDDGIMYAAVSVDGDTLRLTFRGISRISGRCIKEYAFGIRKSNNKDT